jgi:hypothetical protein
MAFAQLAYRGSLRDIESYLLAVQPKLYHGGLRSRVSRSTLPEANEKRDWRIYADFAQVLISIARNLYAHDEFAVEIDETMYALYASTIDLRLSLFPGHGFERQKEPSNSTPYSIHAATSQKTQIRIAVSVYVLVGIVKNSSDWMM